MKVTSKDQKSFKSVDFFRKIKERISRETYDMTFEELKEYLSKRKIQTG